MSRKEFIDTEEEALKWAIRSGPRDVQFSETVVELFKAIVAAQSQMGVAHKGANNPLLKSKYADLAEVIEVCKDALNNNGIAFLQPIATGEKGVVVTTLLTHESGEWLSSSVDFPVGKLDSQEYGKAVSYARRYSLLSLLSIPCEDDDGNTASQRDHTVGIPVKIEASSVTYIKPAQAEQGNEAQALQKAVPTQTYVLNAPRVEPVDSGASEEEIDLYMFVVGNFGIAQVVSVEEKKSRDESKTWWVFSLASKDRNFSAKMWDAASVHGIEDYTDLIGQPIWYRISEKEYRGQQQYTLHSVSTRCVGEDVEMNA